MFSGCKTGKERFADAAALLDYGFANVSVKELTLPEDMPKSIEVNGGMTDSVKLECKVSSKIVVDKGNGAKITTEIDLPDKIDAPVEKNRKIGTLTYLVNSKKVQSFDICAGDSVQKTSFGALLEYVFASLISLCFDRKIRLLCIVIKSDTKTMRVYFKNSQIEPCKNAHIIVYKNNKDTYCDSIFAIGILEEFINGNKVK